MRWWLFATTLPEGAFELPRERRTPCLLVAPGTETSFHEEVLENQAHRFAKKQFHPDPTELQVPPDLIGGHGIPPTLDLLAAAQNFKDFHEERSHEVKGLLRRRSKRSKKTRDQIRRTLRHCIDIAPWTLVGPHGASSPPHVT